MNARVAEIIIALKEWHTARNTLSGDCRKLGIGSSRKDSGEWGTELAKRCEPLRDFCDKLFFPPTEDPIQTISLSIAIGNSDDKLTQTRWSIYCQAANAIIETYAENIHFNGCSHSDAKWQNAAWIINIRVEELETLTKVLTKLRKNYDQDSIAIIGGKTSFI